MNVSAAWLWWAAAGIAVAIELGTGTFYLLMIALGFAAGALAAHLGLGLSLQLVVAAIVAAGATAAWHRHRRRGDAAPPARENRDVNLDIGERVRVEGWSADRTARVQYRGSTWSARLAAGSHPSGGEHTVAAVEGNWLVLAPMATPVR